MAESTVFDVAVSKDGDATTAAASVDDDDYSDCDSNSAVFVVMAFWMLGTRRTPNFGCGRARKKKASKGNRTEKKSEGKISPSGCDRKWMYKTNSVFATAAAVSECGISAQKWQQSQL